MRKGSFLSDFIAVKMFIISWPNLQSGRSSHAASSRLQNSWILLGSLIRTPHQIEISGREPGIEFGDVGGNIWNILDRSNRQEITFLPHPHSAIGIDAINKTVKVSITLCDLTSPSDERFHLIIPSDNKVGRLRYLDFIADMILSFYRYHIPTNTARSSLMFGAASSGLISSIGIFPSKQSALHAQILSSARTS